MIKPFNKYVMFFGDKIPAWVRYNELYAYGAYFKRHTRNSSQKLRCAVDAAARYAVELTLNRAYLNCPCEDRKESMRKHLIVRFTRQTEIPDKTKKKGRSRRTSPLSQASTGSGSAASKKRKLSSTDLVANKKQKRGREPAARGRPSKWSKGILPKRAKKKPSSTIITRAAYKEMSEECTPLAQLVSLWASEKQRGRDPKKSGKNDSMNASSSGQIMALKKPVSTRASSRKSRETHRKKPEAIKRCFMNGSTSGPSEASKELKIHVSTRVFENQIVETPEASKHCFMNASTSGPSKASKELKKHVSTKVSANQIVETPEASVFYELNTSKKRKALKHCFMCGPTSGPSKASKELKKHVSTRVFANQIVETPEASDNAQKETRSSKRTASPPPPPKANVKKRKLTHTPENAHSVDTPSTSTTNADIIINNLPACK